MTRAPQFSAAAMIALLASLTALAGPAADDDVHDTRERLLDEVARSWRPPEPPPAAVTAGAPAETESPLMAKLNAITMPVVNFSDIELSRAVNALSTAAAELDRSGAPAKGVNIVLLDPAGANPKVTLGLRNLSLKRVLDFVTESVGYQYEVQDDAVVVRPGGESGALATEMFPVARATIIRMTGQGGSSADKGAPVGNETLALRAFFQQAGVHFDGVADSSLVCDGSSIIVTQTPRNLDRVRAILRRYREVRQVEIEAKFMEVQEGALEELGIQWSAGRRPLTSADPQTGLPASNFQEQYRTADPAAGTAVNRTLADAFRHSQRSSDIIVDGQAVGSLAPPTLPGANNLGQAAGNLVSISGAIGEFDVNAIVRALSQKSGTDLLSAPRVTVLSGSEAVITVAQEMRYPRSFSEIQSQVGTGRTTTDGGGGSAGVTITAGTPQDFATRNVGVELRVTPVVEEDGRGISLELNPKVTEFEGFIEYGGPSIAVSGGRTVTVPPGFFQPIFSVREVRTRVTLWDGATIIMGGLTREEVKKVEDKVPILGSIPLIGRAFRSKGESTQKRNLLIFLTATLVDPGGAPKRASREKAQNTQPVSH